MELEGEQDFDIGLDVSAISRTLLASGFEINDFQRHPDHVVYSCSKPDSLELIVNYLLAFTDSAVVGSSLLDQVRRDAARTGSVGAVIAKGPGEGWLSWGEFTEALGGAIPDWRPLSEEWRRAIRAAGRNDRAFFPSAEPWLAYEVAIADGLTFVFGRRVVHLGGRHRGQRLGDIVGQASDEFVFLVDAKSSASALHFGSEYDRALREYVGRQRARQRGSIPLATVIVVADSFAQADERLLEISRDFLAADGIPITFVTTDDIIALVDRCKAAPALRIRLRWRTLLCRGGRFDTAAFDAEMRAAQRETVGRV